MSQNVLAIIPTGSFMVSSLMIKYLSHFEFIFVHGEGVCSNFIDFMLVSLSLYLSLFI